jgi:hypothetical protein
MRAPRVLVVAAAAVAVAAAVAGCGDQSGAVRAKVREFAAAAREHDYATLCRDVLAPALVADMARVGLGCRQGLALALGDVTSPRLVIGNVIVRDGTATVLTLSQAAGQKTVLTSLRLVQTRNGWRIRSLGSPTG